MIPAAIKSVSALQNSGFTGYRTTLVDQDSPQRAAAERFIHDIYAKQYQADLGSFLPYLLSIKSPDRGHAAIAGLRPAASSKLFLENYLPSSIDSLLGVERGNIVEVGNLAPAGAGQARWLITSITALLYSAGFTHVVFTATPLMFNAFRRMRLPLNFLAKATADCLPPEEKARWGSYYCTEPKVYWGDINYGITALFSRAQNDPVSAAIWADSCAAGIELRGKTS